MKLLVLLLAQTVLGQVVDFTQSFQTQYFLLNGKAADPCQFGDGVGPGGPNVDCVSKEVPDAYNTVLFPSTSSVLPAGSTLKNLVDGLLPLTITGQNLAPGTLWLTTQGGNCRTGVDAATAVPVVCLGGAATCTRLTFQPINNWFTNELETAPRKICYTVSAAGGTAFYTGFKLGVVWDCDSSVTTKTCAQLPTITSQTPGEAAIRSARTFCCRHTRMGPSTTVATTIQFQIGQCVNPNVTTCCQGAIVEPARQRCCNADFELVQWQENACPCKGSAPSCPSGETCCQFTKYPELANTQTNWPELPGQCYNQSTHRCCDTGLRYDPGTDQCCNITGIQSNNIPCPCGSNADCQGGQTASLQGDLFGVPESMICCQQDQPAPNEASFATITAQDGTARLIPRCSKYANFPSGTSPYQAQRCLGVCMDNRYQICCNGVLCHREFDKCCNSTCCNKRVGTCMEAIRPGTPGNRHNYVDYMVRYEVCSTIEQMDPLNAYWIFVLPVFLLASTFLGVAVVVAFIYQSTRRSYSFIERSMITLAVLITIFGLPAYFAPIYKYGVWICFTSIVTMITAAARLRWLNAVAVVLNFVLLMYLFDPFDGNAYFNFASLRVDSGDADPESGGLLASVGKMWRSLDSVLNKRYCTSWYDYFAIDFQLRDDDRHYNPSVVTYGYCSRGWVTALLIFEGLVLILTLLQFVLSLVALVLRFAEERSYDPIELEVRGADEVPLMMYGQ